MIQKYIIRGTKNGKIELESYHQYFSRKKNPVSIGEPYTLLVPIETVIKQGDIVMEKNGKFHILGSNIFNKY